MYSRYTVVCSMELFVFVFVCLTLPQSIRAGSFDIQCTWPAFNCKAKNSHQSFALSRELRGTPALLDECSNLQWTCRNGQCIAASSRCNGMSNCIDGSDETDCQGVGHRDETSQWSTSLDIVTSRRNKQASSRHNCTVQIGEAHGRFCRRRYRGYYSHPLECEKYIVCEWGDYHECQCPPLTRWDPKIVACIWKYMSPCVSRDMTTAIPALAMHPSQIARLIELITRPHTQFNRHNTLNALVQSQFQTSRMRESNPLLPDPNGIPVRPNNRHNEGRPRQLNGNGPGSVAQ